MALAVESTRGSTIDVSVQNLVRGIVAGIYFEVV